MQTTESEYFLLQHLIGTKDKQLAQKVELLIWRKGPRPDPDIVSGLCHLVEMSEGEDHLDTLLRAFVIRSGVEFDTSGKDVALVGSRDGELRTIVKMLQWCENALKSREEESLSTLADNLTTIIVLVDASI